MRVGLFADFENPHGAPPAAAMAAQIDLVRHAETLGFHEAWVSEHHCNGFSLSGASYALLAYLAAVTSRIRLGSAATLLSLHHPLHVAEAVATVDVLSGGRLLLGVARGGPFPAVFAAFGAHEEESGPRMIDALDIVLRLLRGETVSHTGSGLTLKDALLFPRPSQEQIPVYVASLAPESIRYAAAQRLGLMTALGVGRQRIAEAQELYLRASDGIPPRFVLICDCLVASTEAEARRRAGPFLRQYGRLVRSPVPEIEPLSVAAEDANCGQLVGSPAQCVEWIGLAQIDIGIDSLILKKSSFDIAHVKESLDYFSTEVQPML